QPVASEKEVALRRRPVAPGKGEEPCVGAGDRVQLEDRSVMARPAGAGRSVEQPARGWLNETRDGMRAPPEVYQNVVVPGRVDLENHSVAVAPSLGRHAVELSVAGLQETPPRARSVGVVEGVKRRERARRRDLEDRTVVNGALRRAVEEAVARL